MKKYSHVIYYLFLLPIFLQIEAYSQKAAFTADKSAGCSPLVVTFDASTSEGTQLIYSWDFGNGNSSSGPDKVLPSASYFDPGVYTVKLTVSNTAGTSIETKTNYITVFPKPATQFETSDNILGCIPHSMQFTNRTPEGSAPIKLWTWDFGDGESSELQNPQHTYTTPGDYNISLLTTDANGCKNSVLKKDAVHIREQLEVDFSTTPVTQTFCKLPVTASFSSKTKNNTGYPTNYLWDFGDGSSSIAANPQHEYTVSGNFPVSLIIKNDIPGCEATKKISSLINIATFTTDFSVSTNGCLPVTATFTNLSTMAPGTNFTWDFGDGSPPSHDLNPVHSYTQPGQYSVSLLMTLSDPSCNPPPVVKNNIITVAQMGAIDFTSNAQTSCDVPFDVTFSDLINDGISWAWDFGDGRSSSEHNPTHTYIAKGSYIVTLYVTEANGCVKKLVKPNFIQLNSSNADFTSTEWNGCLPFNPQFTDKSTTQEPVVSRLWNFGDGSSSTELSPTHTYNTPGAFPVTLTVTTASGCSATSLPRVVRTGNKPHAEFLNNFPQEGCKPLVHSFQTNLSNNYDSLFLLPEPGGSILIKPNDPSINDYTYSAPGIFSPAVIAFNGGCADTFSFPNGITVLPPKAIIKYTVPPCNAGAVSFEDASIGATSIYWDFGTGSPHDTSTARYPTFNYPAPGNYTVTLRAIYDSPPKHCEDVTTVKIYVPDFTAGQRDFSADVQQGCAPLSVKLSPNVSFADPTIKINSYQWLFGDGSKSSDTVAKYDYPPGLYDVILVVNNSRGCIDTIVKKKFIKSSKPQAGINSPSTGCFPFQLNSSDNTKGIFPIQKRTWKFGSEVISHGNDTAISYLFNKKSPKADQQKNGTTLSLTVVDNLGCKDSVSKKIFVTVPIINFKKEITPTCFGDTILFQKSMSNDTSGVGPFTLLWNFKDTSIIGDTAKYFFPKGSNVSYLKVTDKQGCADSVNILSDVSLSSPKANFTATPRLITCWPGQVTFKDSTLKGKSAIKEYKWDFGDTSSVSILKNPSHIYNNSGVYNIKLIVVDSIGCSDTIEKKDFITIRGPSGTFIEDTTFGYAPLKVSFTTTSSNVAKYIWDYGDGTLGSEESADHVYEHPGNYIPKLIVEDELGCKNIFQKDTIKVILCAPAMQRVDTSICFGNTIQLSAGYPNGKHEWYGIKDTVQSIIVDTSGLFVSKITIPGMPCFAYDTFRVKVIDLRFDLGNDTALCFGKSMLLDTKVSSEYLFSWNNGSKDSSIMVTTSGIYQLSIDDKDSLCHKEDKVNIEVLPLVKANAGHDINICKGESATLKGNGGTRFMWLPSKVPAATFSYKPSKTSNLTLTVTDSLHCSESTDTMTINVNPLPVSQLPQKQIFCFEDSSYIFPGGNGLHYEWNPGNQSSPVFTANEEGTYSVKLFNQWGCSVESDIILQAICPPKVFPPEAFSPNNDGSNDAYRVFGENFKNYEITIFNRWGEIIFKSNDPEISWDGNYNSESMPAGVYPFTISYESLYPEEEGIILRKKGSIILIR